MTLTPTIERTLLAASLAACALATGCATKYAPPPGSDTAQLRISADQFFGLLGGSVRAVYYRDGSCDKPEVLAVISKIHTSKSDASPLLPPMTAAEADTNVDRVIEANTPVNITMFSARPGYFCSLPLTFKAEANQAYRLRFYWDYDEMKCRADAALIDQNNPTQVLKVQVAKQANQCKTGLDLPSL